MPIIRLHSSCLFTTSAAPAAAKVNLSVIAASMDLCIHTAGVISVFAAVAACSGSERRLPLTERPGMQQAAR